MKHKSVILKTLALNVALFFAAPGFSQTITNLRYEDTKGKVIIYYDLDCQQDSFLYFITIRPVFSDERNSRPFLMNIEGDVWGVRCGNNKSIVWNSKKESLVGRGELSLEIKAQKSCKINYKNNTLEVAEIVPSSKVLPVTNIRFWKENDRIKILYDIKCNNDSSEYSILINPIINGKPVLTEGLGLSAIEGDLQTVKCGRDKVITWDYKVEPSLFDKILDKKNILSLSIIINQNDSSRRSYLIDKDTSNTETYVVVEVMPTFPGGDNALFRYIYENIKYPVEAKENKMTGIVILRFVITREGKVDDISVVRGVHPLLDEEAKRIIREMPDWIPGTQDGKRVNVYYSLPISFGKPLIVYEHVKR